MKSNEFAYWLQGYFELRNAGAGGVRVDLAEEQWKVVRNHIDLVKVTAKGKKQKVSEFITWIDAAIGVATELKTDSTALTQLVEKKLAETFIHVIDKTYGKDLEKALDIHEGKGPQPESKPTTVPFIPRARDYPSGGGSYGNTRYGC